MDRYSRVMHCAIALQIMHTHKNIQMNKRLKILYLKRWMCISCDQNGRHHYIFISKMFSYFQHEWITIFVICSRRWMVYMSKLTTWIEPRLSRREKQLWIYFQRKEINRAQSSIHRHFILCFFFAFKIRESMQELFKMLIK